MPPPAPQAVEGFNKFNMHSVTVLCWQTLNLTQWSMVEMLWIICKCRSLKKTQQNWAALREIISIICKCRKLIVFLRIVVWHIRVFSPFLHVWGYGAGCCDIKKRSKKCTSRPNFDNLKHYIVTAKNWIGNVYFMLFLIAWFKSLSSLKHEFSIRLFDPAAWYMLNNVC